MPRVSEMAFQFCGALMAVLASGLTLSIVAPHTLLPPLPLGAWVLLLLPVPLIWRWCEVIDHWLFSDIPIQPPLRLVSNLVPLHSICLASGSELHHLPPPLPSAPSAPLLLLGWWTMSSWCGLASRAKWDTMHNYVVRGHHDGSISVQDIASKYYHSASFKVQRSLKWRLTRCVMASSW